MIIFGFFISVFGLTNLLLFSASRDRTAIHKKSIGGMFTNKVEINPHLESFPPVAVYIAPQMNGAGAYPNA